MWEIKKPVYGDQIRVSRGLYSHHGIYESDDSVIQFASPVGSEVSPETAIIITTTLDNFLKGGECEVRTYTIEELENKKDPKEIVEFAKSKLGSNMGGYDLFSNNCEHFSNLCAFGKSESEQINKVNDLLSMLFGGRN